MITKEKVKKYLIAYGVNEKTIGFEMATELFMKMLNSNEKKPMKDYYSYIADKFNVGVVSVQAYIRYSITTTNKYGKGLSIKQLFKIIQKTEKGGKNVFK